MCSLGTLIKGFSYAVNISKVVAKSPVWQAYQSGRLFHQISWFLLWTCANVPGAKDDLATAIQSFLQYFDDLNKQGRSPLPLRLAQVVRQLLKTSQSKDDLVMNSWESQVNLLEAVRREYTDTTSSFYMFNIRLLVDNAVHPLINFPYLHNVENSLRSDPPSQYFFDKRICSKILAMGPCPCDTASLQAGLARLSWPETGQNVRQWFEMVFFLAGQANLELPQLDASSSSVVLDWNRCVQTVDDLIERAIKKTAAGRAKVATRAWTQSDFEKELERLQNDCSQLCRMPFDVLVEMCRQRKDEAIDRAREVFSQAALTKRFGLKSPNFFARSKVYRDIKERLPCLNRGSGMRRRVSYNVADTELAQDGLREQSAELNDT